jgi:hypothetical protein
MTYLHRVTLAVLVVAAVAGCASSAGGTHAPQASAAAASAAASAGGGSPAAAGPVTSPDQAAQRVIALDPRFAGLQPKNPDLIGACCFYEAVPSADGYRVTVEIGWGDCPSGCINRHRWTYAVTGDGTTTLEAESGEPVPSGVPPGGGGSTGY